MSLFSRARKIYATEGGFVLLRRMYQYFLFEILPEKILWRLLPRSKTKQILAKSGLLSALYFYLRGSFRSEQKGILHGQTRYHEDEHSGGEPVHYVIRNVHRIEKGLSMRDRRDVFAESYIEETTDAAIDAWSNETLDEEQLEWTLDVLARYFGVVDETPPITRAKSTFEDFYSDIDYISNGKHPKERSHFENSSVSFEDLRRLSEQRSSTRWFKDRPVPRDAIDSALEIALQSPSACNRQSYEFRFYDDPDLISEITELPVGVSGYRDNIPCLGVLVGNHRAYESEQDRHVIYIDASLAAMAFQFALETKGFGSCCINWPVIRWRERRMADMIGLEDDQEVIMLIAIGYPDPGGKIPYSEKKRPETVRSFNET